MLVRRRGARRLTHLRPAHPRRRQALSAAQAGNSLCQTDLFRLQTLRPALYDKRHFRAFIERAVPCRLDGGKMDKDVFPILALDKTKSLGCVKPLHRTGFFHVSLFLLCDQLPARIETRTIQRTHVLRGTFKRIQQRARIVNPLNDTTEVPSNQPLISSGGRTGRDRPIHRYEQFFIPGPRAWGRSGQHWRSSAVVERLAGHLHMLC
jgi:hypothetical protein